MVRTLFFFLIACKGATVPGATDPATPIGTEPPVCQNDTDEPNDATADAADLGAGKTAVLSAQDEDFWFFAAPPGMRAVVRVGSVADVDAELLFPTGSVIDSSTQGVAGETEELETVSLLDANQTFLVRAFLSAGAPADACETYTVDVEFSCTDDGDVPDERSQAQPMVIGDEQRGQAARTDTDWYAIEVDRNDDDTLLLNFAGSAGALEWEVWLEDSPDQLLDSGTAQNGFPLVLNNADAEPLTFLVGITHASGGCNLYDLVLED